MQEKYLPLFPLNLVVFPTEQLNLHIFEPRYKQLIADLLEQGTSFGIPVFANGSVGEYGTEMELLSIEKTYPNGELDIKTRGLGVFKIHHFFAKAPDKMYPAGKVQPIENNDTQHEPTLLAIIQQIRLLYQSLGITKEFSHFHSFSIAHYVGLGIEQEYELLQLTTEVERQDYLLAHLQKTVPVVMETQRLKDLIHRNGHFRNLPELGF